MLQFDTVLQASTQKKVSKKNTPYLIAEIGLNHNKNLDLAKKMIESAKANGADAVKFQSYTTEKFIHPKIEKVKGLFEIFKQYELTLEEHLILQKFSQEHEIDFFSTPLSLDWVEHLTQMKVPFFKIASGDINNFQLLERVVEHNIPIIVSLGAANLNEIEKVKKFFIKKNRKDILFNHCVSIYPTPIEKLNLAKIPYLEKKLQALIGFSDHTNGWMASFSAVIAGAVSIEKHFTLDKELDGPDHKISASPKELLEIRKKIDEAFIIRGNTQDFPNTEEVKSDYFGKRSLYNIDGKTLALRPRDNSLPKDSDWLI